MIDTYSIHIPILNNTVNIVIVDDFSELNSEYNTNSSNNIEACTFVYSGNVTIAFIRKRIYNMCIVHECKHAVNFIFRQQGIQLDLVNDEFECYLLGFLFDSVTKLELIKSEIK